MYATGSTPAALPCRPRAGVFRCVLVLVCVAACAGWLDGQSNQAAQSSSGAQQAAPAQQSQTQQAPSQQPMVIGEGPEGDDSAAAPPAATAPAPVSPAPATKQPTAGQPAPWNSAIEAPGAPAKPAAVLSLSQPAPPPEPALPPVHAADAGGDQARQQINNECADMMQMANDLKAEVDKTTKDVLSIAVVRKANDIEQLARRVRDQMRPEIGKN